MRLRRIVVATMLVLGVACSDSKDGEPRTDTAATTSASVDVVARGNAPRRLRMRPTAGTEQLMTMRQEQTQRAGLSGQSQTLESPTTEFDMRHKVVAVRNGRIETETVYEAVRVLERPGVDATALDAVRQALAGFAGKTGKVAYDDRGAVLDVDLPDLDIGGDAGALARQLLSGFEDQTSAMALPLPEEPVGVGAKWVVKSSPRISGLKVNVTTELTLTELTDTFAVASVAQTMEFERGATEIEGTEVVVESGGLAGAGTARWEFSKVVPLVNQTIEGTAVFRIGEGDQQQRFEQYQRQTISTVSR